MCACVRSSIGNGRNKNMEPFQSQTQNSDQQGQRSQGQQPLPAIPLSHGILMEFPRESAITHPGIRSRGSSSGPDATTATVVFLRSAVM